MAPSSLLSTICYTGLAFILLGPQLTDCVQIITCQGGSFYNPQLRACQICRACPRDQIILEPCSTLTDTKCGAFEGFDAKDFETVQLPHIPQGESPDGVVPGGPKGGNGGATREYKTVSWKNIGLISVGFFMTVAALISIVVIIVRILFNRKEHRVVHYTPDGRSLVIVKTIGGVEQHPTLAQVTSLVKPREEVNPLYDVTASLLSREESMRSKRPLFPHKTIHNEADRDSGIGH